MPRVKVGPHAESTPLDDTNLSFDAETVQEGFENQNSAVIASGSPGWSFGRSGNNNKNSWLLRVGSVPSNKVGVPVRLNSAKIVGISVGNEDINTFDVAIYSHDGDEVNLAVLVVVQIVASRTGVFSVDVPVTTGKQLAARITEGSAKNVGVDLEIKGVSP